jgi:glycosyltransferase involved in cell wall biosynthesis
MADTEIFREKFNSLHICVIIPTYNNARTLTKVIADVAAYTNNIIIVNDGSTDDTENKIASLPAIRTISYPKNQGKGWALRKGFELAVELGYQYAITVDSDGQHFASDLPLFIDKLEKEGTALIMGVRNMGLDFVPGKSSFGNKFSNFWFWVETGIKCPDTQTGFRLYPVALLKTMYFFTRKYEFEIEVLVRAAWKGIKINWVPVMVYYEPKESRVSHFRPFKAKRFFSFVLPEKLENGFKRTFVQPLAAGLCKSIVCGVRRIYGYHSYLGISTINRNCVGNCT